MNGNTGQPELLAIVELGGYPSFVPLYQETGYSVTLLTSMRKALAHLKTNPPDVIVAEYNYQHTFRDRSSNLETLLSVLERLPQTRLIVFYEPEHADKLSQLQSQYRIFRALPYPVDATGLAAALRAAAT